MEAVADTSERYQGSIVNKLKAAIGAENVKTSKGERLLYSHDMAPLPKEAQLAFKNIPDVVVRPRSTEDVSKIVKICLEEGTPITPRGASTWGLAGSMPAYGGVLIDMMGGMGKVLKIDEENMTITCQAGCSWKQAYDAAWEKGFLLGSYPSSFPSATLAGWISTAGVGVGNYKYGSAGDNIRNMKVVIPDGTIVDTGFETLADNMSGYNLNRLFVGAEGTLGVICEVTLKLSPRPELLRPIAYEFESLDLLQGPIHDITRSRVMPLHIAWSDNNHFAYLKKMGQDPPTEGSILLVVLEGDKAMVELEEKAIDDIVAKRGGKKLSYEVGQHEWDERCYEFRCRKIGVGSVPMEVLVPTSSYAAMTKDLYELMKSMKMEGAIIGIMTDRNTAMFMPYYIYDAESFTKGVTSLSFNFKCGDLAIKNGGRMLGGFGLFFGPLLQKVRGEGYAIQTAIKKAIDPNDIMNPGKLLGMKTRFGLPVGPGMLSFGLDSMAVVKKILPADKNVDAKVHEMKMEELDKDRFKQHEVDPLKQKKKK
ncbi:MAG: FAD-binding oxidoreductase [Euryarchaeota archaeon]|jgi:glycolate oxidase|nr:FAD-binding oxidoreductase [Euryarchaeota archaeon]